MKGFANQFDSEMDIKHCTHPANSVTITEGQEGSQHSKNVYTDGRKREQEVASGIAIFTGSNITDTKNTD
jgi:hypothetical protein